MRLPHFVKTSCGTPSRKLFRSGLPAHRHRREGWLGRTRGNGGVPPFPFWEICDFPKWLQSINNVLRCKCETYLHNPCEYQIKKYPCGVFFYLVGAHSIPSHGAMRRLRGNRDDLTARVLVKSTCFRTSNRWLRVANRGHEPKTKTPQGRFNFWLGRTDSNHDKENQNLLSYH